MCVCMGLYGARVRTFVGRQTETILFVRKPINRALENGIWPGFNSVRWPLLPPHSSLRSIHPRIDNVPQPTRSQIIYHLHSTQLDRRKEEKQNIAEGVGRG